MGEILLAENVKLDRREVPELIIGEPQVIAPYSPEAQIIEISCSFGASPSSGVDALMSESNAFV